MDAHNWRIVSATLLFLGLCGSTKSAPGALTVKAIAAGGDRSLALTSDGTVWEWGAKRATPAQVTGLSPNQGLREMVRLNYQ